MEARGQGKIQAGERVAWARFGTAEQEGLLWPRRGGTEREELRKKHGHPLE